MIYLTKKVYKGLTIKGYTRYDTYALIVLGVMGLFYSGFIDYMRTPVPYSNVEVQEVYEEGKRVHFAINFEKLDCQFQKILTQTQYFGKWNDAIGWEGEVKGDRLKGSETLKFSLVGSARTIDNVVIRTRHLCPDDVIVDKQFAIGDLAAWLTKFPKQHNTKGR
jgi:hypothetical protein